jgi:hypothetical protein
MISGVRSCQSIRQRGTEGVFLSNEKKSVWCPYREDRVFVEVCRSRCPKARRRSCRAYEESQQGAFDFGAPLPPVKRNSDQ